MTTQRDILAKCLYQICVDSTQCTHGCPLKPWCDVTALRRLREEDFRLALEDDSEVIDNG